MFGCVYMHIHGCVCHTCVCGCVHSQRAFGSQRTILGAFSSRFLLLLICYRVSHWKWTLSIGQAVRLPHFQRSFCLCLPSLSLTLFYMGPGDLNSDPHMCKTSTLPTELSLQPIYLQFLQQNLYLDRYETLCFLNYFLQGKYLCAQLQNC